MNRLRYGEEISGFSTSIRPGYEDVQLYLGGANTYNDNRLVASFEMHGIAVQVFEQDAAGKIVSLWKENRKHELLQYLETILFAALKQDPQYILDMLVVEYNRGVMDGRSQKAKEIRNVLMLD